MMGFYCSLLASVMVLLAAPVRWDSNFEMLDAGEFLL